MSAVTEIKSHRKPAYVSHLTAMDLYLALRDAAEGDNLTLVSGVSPNGRTFVGAYVAGDPRYQASVTADGTVLRTVDYLPMETFPAMALPARRLERYIAEHRGNLAYYAELDQMARELASIEVNATRGSGY